MTARRIMRRRIMNWAAPIWRAGGPTAREVGAAAVREGHPTAAGFDPAADWAGGIAGDARRIRGALWIRSRQILQRDPGNVRAKVIQSQAYLGQKKYGDSDTCWRGC